MRTAHSIMRPAGAAGAQAAGMRPGRQDNQEGRA